MHEQDFHHRPHLRRCLAQQAYNRLLVVSKVREQLGLGGSLAMRVKQLHVSGAVSKDAGW